ncbi:BFD-like (2Fe-2S) protein [Desulfovibrio sp. XJ01]|nr:BFD-like (2Fe-2S) protein [Nitratidesulfovibrio liaohensis]
MNAELICYCFGYTAADIKADVILNGRSTILERIVQEKQGGICRCAETNPSSR